MTFQDVMETHFKTLSQYIPIVTRVHGAHHLEMYEVQQVFARMEEKLMHTGTPDLHQEFLTLRKLTNNYTVPNDVCESYEAVYRLLSEADTAYHQRSR